MRARNVAIAAMAIGPTLSLLGYWFFWRALEAVDTAISNLGDLHPNESWDWDDWDEWDGVK